MSETLIIEGNLTITNHDDIELNFVDDGRFAEGYYEGKSVEMMILEHFAPGANRWDWVRVGKVRITIEVLDTVKPHGVGKKNE